MSGKAVRAHHRAKRREAGYRTQQDLAAEVGVHKSTVANWETGVNPYPQWLERFLEIKAERDRYLDSIPRLPNCGKFMAIDNKGQWHYLNHANTWQTFQGFPTDETPSKTTPPP